jgi:hypothetical protein
MKRVVAFALAAIAVLGVATPAAAQVFLAPDRRRHRRRR